MSEVTASSIFPTAARQQVRTALELATKRTAENASRVAAELGALASQAAALGHGSIADLARRGSEQARLIDRDHAAVTACARILRELARAIEALERSPRRPHRVLVVDDSSLNATVVCDALQRAAFETRYVEDADSAVADIVRFAPDVVLVDVHMPDTTPVELCARLRAAVGARAVRLVLFSGLPDEELAVIEQETRADGFVSKERGIDAVVDEVTSVCRRLG
ncbi:MAG: response regulator [Kofleriaceae bacterium]|nr:response regulator [Kofleriaceae bacterium]